MKYLLEPWKHQLNVINKVVVEQRNFYALFHDMGTGKTKTSIEIYRHKCHEVKAHLKCLIIGPLSTLENWKREFLTHSKIEENRIAVIDGTTRKFKKKLKNPSLAVKKEQLNNPRASVFIINTDMVGNKNLWSIIEGIGIQFLIVDEVHLFKNPMSKRSKALHNFSRSPRLKYRYIATGSPILQSALDIWSQFYIMSPKILGQNFFTFRAKYFYDANASMPSHVHFPNWVPKDDKYFRRVGKAKDKNETFQGLNEIIYKYADRVMKDDVLDLPDFITQKEVIVLNKEQRKAYDDLQKFLVAFLEKGEQLEYKKEDLKDIAHFQCIESLPEYMKADLAITKILRLQQINSGIFTTDNGDIKRFKNIPRLQKLKQLLESICSNKKNKVIVWSVFAPTYDDIKEVCEELNIKYTMLTGKQNKDEKQDAMDRFNTEEEVQVIISNQQAGGTGVNLTASNYSIYYSKSFNLAHDLQSEARNYRGGQTRKVTRIDLISEDTIDEQIFSALQAKKKQAEKILSTDGLSSTVSLDFSKEEIYSFIKR